MTRYRGVHHLALATGDLEGTVRFWRDLIGLRLVARLGQPGYRQCFFAVGEVDHLAFFEWTGVEPVAEKDHGVPVRGPFVFDHVSLAVEDAEALWELRDRLEAAGFWVSEVMDHGFFRSIYAFDPNGVPIEFSCGVAGVDVRAHPLLADRSPTRAAAEGSEPRAGHWPPVTRPTAPEDRVVYPGAGSELFSDDHNRRARRADETTSGGETVADEELRSPGHEQGNSRNT